jgi:hypothetical protein
VDRQTHGPAGVAFAKPRLAPNGNALVAEPFGFGAIDGQDVDVQSGHDACRLQVSGERGVVGVARPEELIAVVQDERRTGDGCGH